MYASVWLFHRTLPLLSYLPSGLFVKPLVNKKNGFHDVNEVLAIIVGVRNFFTVIGLELEHLSWVLHLHCIENNKGEFQYNLGFLLTLFMALVKECSNITRRVDP